jgi:hypothetical protein
MVLSLQEKLNQIKLNMGEELSLEDKLKQIKLNLQTTPTETTELSLEDKLSKVKASIAPEQEITTPAPAITSLQTPLGISGQAKGGASLPGAKSLIEGLPMTPVENEPTWGNVVKYSIKSGLGQYQSSLVNILRLIQMGAVKATDSITDIFNPN